MSKRDARRPTTRKPIPTGSGKSNSDSDPSAIVKQWVITLMIMVAAGIVAGIVAKDALRPDGYIHALNAIDAAEFNGELPGGLTDEGVLKRYQSSSNTHPLARPFASRTRAAEAVLDSFRGPLPEDRLKQLSVEADYDGTNLLTRVLVALAYESPLGEDVFPDALARYQYLKRVILQPPAIESVETYSNAFSELFIDAMQPFSEREASVLVTSDAIYYDTWLRTNAPLYEIIPFAIDHLGGLAESLTNAGHEAEATQIRQWLAEICFGLIDCDRDPSLQLIAARGLIALFPDRKDIANPLEELIAAHTTNRKHAFTDSRIIPFSNYETLAPIAYGNAFDAFSRYLASAALFIGAALVTILALVVTFFPTRAHQPQQERNHPLGARLGLYALIIIIVPLAIIWRGADLFQADAHPFLSRDWAVAAVLSFGVIGGALTIIRAIIENAGGSNVIDRLRWGWPALILFVISGLFLALPIQSVVWPLRSVAIVDNWVMVALVIVALLLMAVAIARVPSTRLARVGAICSLLFAMQTAVLQSMHHSADARYQAAVVEGHRDPMAARIGDDWRAKYIEPARTAFAELQP